MRTSARSPDDGDVIRARLRALLAEGNRDGGWVPEDDEHPTVGRPWDDAAGDAPAWDDAAGDAPGWEDAAWDDDPDATHRSASDAALPPGLGRHRAPGRTARLDPGRPGAWALWAAAVLAAATVIGWTWLDRPAVDQVPAGASTVTPSMGAPRSAGATAAATASGTAPGGAGAAGGTVTVSVVGLVTAPGLVTLPAGSRVADALAAVGGLLPDADPASLNAAALLSDGQQIAIGVPAAVPPSGGATAATGRGGPLNLNTATVADLDALPGIGPVLAQRIVDHRTAHGPFTSVDQLDEVSGVGPAIFADLAGRVRV